MEERSAIEDETDEARYGHLRSEPRDSMFLSARLRRPGDDWQTIKVRNLSPGGMMAEVPISLVRAEPIEAELRGIGIVPGKIAWTSGGRVGVVFERPVDPKLARKPVTGKPAPALVQTSLSTWRPSLR